MILHHQSRLVYVKLILRYLLAFIADLKQSSGNSAGESAQATMLLSTAFMHGLIPFFMYRLRQLFR